MKRLIKSFGYALSGIRFCLAKEPNFFIHLLAAIAALWLSLYLNISSIEFMVVIICVAAVLSAEMINTAIEQLCNLVIKERSDAIKTIKDISAGAVLVLAIGALACGLIIFIPKILSLI